ncbi:serine/threonine-protein phosphatase pp2a-related [Anaeramoeba flamelloides]|uniref:Serine/threonine-protein phosphatase n=1 Tax=Anaeramoeba flamelloides TaxID=1746091 RepID=A0AAV7ZK44_9EUKA|nr:serine/threonine-protein phosphatase pp2a-related [Anaeramoeba flamelloides]KAJ6226749.1 serine/threonine-protein phosphatase pp2a-related [Anaeramoeba flamelloides]|eukprot:Anaeramoba_flamelloidesa95429_111.p1 GENE.a95429_111~~a95429_111.p1  ORF type:complete len:313 (+),score=45.86 a95429_111:28-966(+)
MDLDWCLEKLTKNPPEVLPEQVVKGITEQLKEALIYESNVAMVQSPVSVVGDLHGQYYDLVELFRVGGECPETNYLFLGNYVDRGFYSVETISLLVCLKLHYPRRITLLRGNHESKGVTQVYGFYSECLRKYGNANVWKYFTDMFNYLQLAALIDEKIFCVHGGLSPSISSINQIRVLDRFQEIPPEGALTDLVWSDPDAVEQETKPSPRGAGHIFGSQLVDKFLQDNKINHIIRSNQLCMDGHQVLFSGKLITIWSAPNFCYRCGNVASILEVFKANESFTLKYNTYTAAPENERIIPSLETTKEIPDYFK